ncbi:MAG: ribonuclease HII [Lentisphaerae bacterium]|nr:ribonuclease HII [Lentisphaerota bacterium]
MEQKPLLEFEHQVWTSGDIRIAGLDEAGRGPLAGPVVAAALVFDRKYLEKESAGIFLNLNDSKRLTERQREFFFDLPTDNPFVEIGIGISHAAEIDTVNILKATHLAMSRALANLPAVPDHILVDGLPVPGLSAPSTPIVRGDSKSYSIAAASIIAKVTRDKWMISYDKRYPEYGFKNHKGYGTSRHIQALLKYGPTPEHRKTFAPVKDMQGIRGNIEKNPSCEAI